ncbi:MAG: CPBP family intramembrane glutamic endopeptidase [Candidatus Thorarchaeota archaeon]|jgi:membrane protease YdiL (CAAX protease family)
MDDPDASELMEAEGIGIFEPGARFERAVEKGRMIGVLGLTASAMVLMVIFTVIIMLPLIGIPGLIVVDFATMEIYIDPVALLILTTAEVAFVIPPIYYVRKNGLPISSIGIKNMLSGIDIGLGFVIGALMLGSNIAITWLLNEMTGPIASGGELLFARNPAELISWVIVMFVLVGFTEEVLFRGFLQRRMEMYFKGQGNANFKMMSLVITSFIFAVIHFDLIGLPARFILGMFLGDLAQRRNYNIVGPSVAHGFNNAVVVVLASLGF